MNQDSRSYVVPGMAHKERGGPYTVRIVNVPNCKLVLPSRSPSCFRNQGSHGAPKGKRAERALQQPLLVLQTNHFMGNGSSCVSQCRENAAPEEGWMWKPQNDPHRPLNLVTGQIYPRNLFTPNPRPKMCP